MLYAVYIGFNIIEFYRSIPSLQKPSGMAIYYNLNYATLLVNNKKIKINLAHLVYRLGLELTPNQ